MAGVVNPHDTGNGMLLEKSLHVAFYGYQWCVDEFFTVHMSEEGMKGVLKEFNGKCVSLAVGSFNQPSKELLRAQLALYKERQGNYRMRIHTPNLEIYLN